MNVLRRLVRAAFHRLRYGPRPTQSVRIARGLADGFVDDLTVHGDRLAAVRGWAGDLDAFRDALVLRFDDREVPALHAFRVYRSELALPGAGGPFGDVVVEWILPPAAGRATLEAHGRVLATVHVPALAEPAYAFLRDAREVARRDQIYGSGPPVHTVSPEILDLARSAAGSHPRLRLWRWGPRPGAASRGTRSVRAGARRRADSPAPVARGGAVRDAVRRRWSRAV